MQNLVSIITPAYNAEKYISQAIDSVRNQTHQNWEMLIVDDASTDNTPDIVKRLASVDERIICLPQKVNKGTGTTRKIALTLAKGKYIAFLDADDTWNPDKLEKQLAFMKSNNLYATFSFYRCMDENGNPINKYVKTPRTVTYNMLKYSNYIGNLTGIYDAGSIGKIDIPKNRKRQDWIMWLSVVKIIRQIEVTPFYLANYRQSSNSLSSGKFALLKSNFQVYRYYFKMNIIKACVSMILFLIAHFLIKKRYTTNSE